MKNNNPLLILVSTIFLSFNFFGCVKKDECKNKPTEKYTYIQDSIRDDLYCGIFGTLHFKDLKTGEIVGFSTTNNCETEWNIGYGTYESSCYASSKLEMYGHRY